MKQLSICYFIVILAACQLTQKKGRGTRETSSSEVEAFKLPELEDRKKQAHSSLKFEIAGTKDLQLGIYSMPVVVLNFDQAPWDHISFEACHSVNKTCLNGKGVGKEILLPLTEKGVYKVELKACLELDPIVCGPSVSTYSQVQKSLSSEAAGYIKENFIIAQNTEKLVADLKIKTRKYLESPQTPNNSEEKKFDEMLSRFEQVNDVAIARLYLSEAYVGTKKKYIEEEQKNKLAKNLSSDGKRPAEPSLPEKKEEGSLPGSEIKKEPEAQTDPEQAYWNRDRKVGMVLIVLGVSLPLVYGTAAYKLTPFALGAVGGMVAAPIAGYKSAKRFAGRIYTYTGHHAVRGFLSVIATFVGISTGISLVVGGVDRLFLADLDKRQQLLREFDLAALKLEKLRERNELILRNLQLK